MPLPELASLVRDSFLPGFDEVSSPSGWNKLAGPAICVHTCTCVACKRIEGEALAAIAGSGCMSILTGYD